jgi:hypothetical protein
VLQALESGSKQQTPVLLGAEGISRLSSSRSAPDSAKLDFWVRTSLNEQLLGSRLSILAAQQAALRGWYEPGALLLQGTAAVATAAAPAAAGEGAAAVETAAASAAAPLASLLEAVRALDAHRFTLHVGPPQLQQKHPHNQPQQQKSPAGAAQSVPAAVPAAAGGGGSMLGNALASSPFSGLGGLATFQWPGGGSGGGSDAKRGGGRRQRVAAMLRGGRGQAAGGGEAQEEEDDDSGSAALSPLSTSDETTPDWWTSGAAPWPSILGGEEGGAGGGAEREGAEGRAPSAAAARLQCELEAALAAPVPALLQGRGSSQGGSGESSGAELCCCIAHVPNHLLIPSYAPLSPAHPPPRPPRDGALLRQPEGQGRQPGVGRGAGGGGAADEPSCDRPGPLGRLAAINQPINQPLDVAALDVVVYYNMCALSSAMQPPLCSL